MFRRRLLSIALTLTVFAAAAACGNDDGDGDDAGAGAGGEVAAFCEAFAEINEEGEAAFEEGQPDADELRALVDRVRNLDPPDEIADDLATVTEAQALFAEALDGDADAQGELESRIDELEAADERLEPFLRDECGLEYGD